MPTKNEFFCLLLFEGIFMYISEIKSQKELIKSRNQGYFLAFLMEGSGSVQIMTDPDLDSPKTYKSYGSGSTTQLQ
jgi:hypothetical protein